MNVNEISKENQHFAEKARTKKASISDLQGSCLPLPILGYWRTAFTPIINAPKYHSGISEEQRAGLYQWQI